MKLEKLERIKTLMSHAKTLRKLPDTYLSESSKSQCDKHGLMFGGDQRFSVFKATVFLDAHLGYYGSGSCSRMASLDDKDCGRYLNAALNIHRDAILATMADCAEREAASLRIEAEAEIAAARTLLDSIVAEQEVQ